MKTVLTENVFETTFETAIVLHHGELTDQSDYLFDANDSIDKNYLILMMNWIILCYLKMKTLMKMKMQLRLNCVRSYAHGMENNVSREGMNELLKIMQSYDLPLPLDTRTLLR